MQAHETRHQPVRDNLRFLRLWLQRPGKLGAVLPSSKSLAAAMASEIDLEVPGLIVELGGGTGNITAALLENGADPRDIVVIEREAALCGIIAERFPQVRVIRGDATQLRGLLEAHGVGPLKAVVSSLPLLTMPKEVERSIVTEAFSVLPAEGTFVQFTYGPTSPIGRAITTDLEIAGERSHWVLDNLPPAAVWVFRRAPSPRH